MKLDTLPVLRARHTLVKIAPGADASTVEAAGLRLTAIRAPIVAGADFGHVARSGSEEASACEGGHLGYFPRGRRVPQFEAAAFALAPGAISHSHHRIERIDDD
ncbi:peptidylprolyl isomerase [Pseudomonas azerbaijanorientalis]|uniref:peptidylprolyl isomerase n=1 Tax=Pseudomonas azerbaijanorientalis TaxID=2842350 RepID=UPI001C3C7C0F|nr:peptidylprolyl isomerase [Pseudomonas azerbaijanorientalis]QXH63870.1 peptidyl-prolyl cis-trans isomerase [Pseudomonas azerbaijanorientalis]